MKLRTLFLVDFLELLVFLLDKVLLNKDQDYMIEMKEEVGIKN